MKKGKQKQNKSWSQQHWKELLLAVSGLVILSLSLYIMMDKFEVFSDIRHSWKVDSVKVNDQQLLDTYPDKEE